MCFPERCIQGYFAGLGKVWALTFPHGLLFQPYVRDWLKQWLYVWQGAASILKAFLVCCNVEVMSLFTGIEGY